MSCENASLSLLIKRGDITTIAIVVGVAVGSFLLGTLTTIGLRLLRGPTSTSYLVDSKPDADSHSVTERISDDDVAFLPSRSLSQTFVRHSLKPPMNMFSTKEKSKWNSSQPIPFHDRQNSENPFGSIGKAFRSSLASEGTPRDRVELIGSHHVHVYNPRIFDAHHQRDSATRQSASRSTTGSTICETGSMADLLVTTTHFMGEKAKALGYPSQDSARPERNSIQRARSGPRIAHSGREKTKHKLSAHELRRMRTFLSPEHDSNSPVMEMHERKRSRRPRLTITHLSETTIDSSGSPGTALRKEQEPDLTRQNSQRAVAFYQEHANRHLSLPRGGQLRSSTVLPDSPSGVIGDSSLA